MRTLVFVAVAACGSHTAIGPDGGDPGSDGAAQPDATVDAPAPDDPFWSTCGDAAIDFNFVDSGAPFAVGRDGTMYSVVRIGSGGTGIARMRPGQAAEMTWLTVAPQQVYAVEGLAAGPASSLFFTGYVDNVHGLYRVTGSPPTMTRLGDVLPSPASFETLQFTGTRLYMIDYQSQDLWLVDLETGARTSAAHHPGYILHFVIASPTTAYLTSLNAPLTKVTLDASGIEASREPVTAFGTETVYKVGFDAKGRLYAMTMPPHSFELLERFDPATSTRTILYGGNVRWSDWTFGRGPLRCDLLITSQTSPITDIQMGDQTPAWP
jgi:hypothetical protein